MGPSGAARFSGRPRPDRASPICPGLRSRRPAWRIPDPWWRRVRCPWWRGATRRRTGRTATATPALRATSIPWSVSRRNGCSNALDGEAPEIVVGLRRIELLAHDLEALRTGGRRREPDLFHELGGIGGEIDLLGHRLVVDIALDLSPPLHLGKDPDGERWPRERIEIDAVGVALHVAEPVGIGAGEDLLEHGLGLIEVVRRRYGRGDLLAVLAFMRERGRVDDRFEQRRVGVRHGRNELLGSGQRAARVSLPQLLRQDVDEADAVVDRALVERIGAEEAVEIVGA